MKVACVPCALAGCAVLCCACRTPSVCAPAPPHVQLLQLHALAASEPSGTAGKGKDSDKKAKERKAKVGSGLHLGLLETVHIRSRFT